MESALQTCLSYLRENYFYCFYCGAKFDAESELASKCPGWFEDDH